MIDDGQIVSVTQDEYHGLIGKITSNFYHSHDGIWEFPWKGRRLVRIETGERVSVQYPGTPEKDAYWVNK